MRIARHYVQADDLLRFKNAELSWAWLYEQSKSTCMLVLVTAVNHSPATDMTSSPCEIWLKNRGWATTAHRPQRHHWLKVLSHRTRHGTVRHGTVRGRDSAVRRGTAPHPMRKNLNTTAFWQLPLKHYALSPISNRRHQTPPPVPGAAL